MEIEYKEFLDDENLMHSSENSLKRLNEESNSQDWLFKEAQEDTKRKESLEAEKEFIGQIKG